MFATASCDDGADTGSPADSGGSGADPGDAAADPDGSGGDDTAADTDGSGADPGDAAADPDGSGDGDTAADTGGDSADTTPPVPEFIRRYSLAESFAAPQGFVWRRSIIHLHSTHSHDACDNTPRVDGDYNYPCLAKLRDALCKVRIDVASLTDHRAEFGNTPWPDTLLYDPATDELGVGELGHQYNVMTCPDGFRVTITAGMETAVMPLSFAGPLSPDQAENFALLDGSDGVAMSRFRAAGALSWVAHTESKTLEQLDDLQVQGLELYNLHANIDPDIRPLLGLDAFAFFTSIGPFIGKTTRAHPDLALLAFLDVNQNALDKWATVSLRRPVVGTAGTDAHENVLPNELLDGERMDSYRRMMSWFSNYVLAADDSLDAFRDGLTAGRLFVAFDTLGDPAGFDAWAEPVAGTRIEMGRSGAPDLTTSSIRATVPVPVDALGGSPSMRTVLLRSNGTTWVQVAEAGTGDVRFPVTEPGVYRIEVRMVPSHLRPYLDRLTRLADKEQVWIYTNTFRLVPA
jgi:hypothetical protein